MNRSLLIAAVAAFAVAFASAQTDTTGYAENTPAENVSGSAISARSPGSWVREALARHEGVMTDRFNGGYSNDASSSSSGSSSSGLAGLLDLASEATGTSLSGLSGSLGSLGNLLGSSSSGLSSLISGTTSGSASTGTSSTSGSQYTIEDLIRLRDTGYIDPVFKPQNRSQTTDEQTSTSGAIARLPKFDQTAQTTTTTEETPFRIRWSDAMLGTFFTALAFGMSTQDFIDTLADGLRPLIRPSSVTSDGSDGDSTSDGSDGGSSSDGSSTGEGIEDVTPDGTGSGDPNDSIV